jgi:hypothetical protein
MTTSYPIASELSPAVLAKRMLMNELATPPLSRGNSQRQPRAEAQAMAPFATDDAQPRFEQVTRHV